jgi:SAM-dependent methyltransferase
MGAAPDPDKLNALIGQFIQDLGATMHGSTVVLGEKLGLYVALRHPGGLRSTELAAATGTSERFVREWLAAQVVSKYVSYDATSDRYYLTPEQEFVLADETGPAYFPGAFILASANYRDEGRIVDAYRSGRGIGWHERDENLFVGTSKFFRPNYVGNLVSGWIPALEGVAAKLEAGARVADVGCGYGSSTLIMAQAFPRSEFFGFDYHKGSVEAARLRASVERAVERVHFDTASAQDFPGPAYDLVTFFDCLHDMSDPVGAARQVRKNLLPGGTWMVVEPAAGESLAENMNPVSRVFYSASSMICTPASLSDPNGAGLGAQASSRQLREVAEQGGFTQFRLAANTPFNRVFEIRA